MTARLSIPRGTAGPLRRAKAPVVPEAAVLRACLSYLAVRGIEAWRTNSGLAMLPGRGGRPQPVRFGKRGVADILGFLPDGRFLAVECKSSTGKLRPEQAVFLERVNRAGGVGIVARSLDDLISALNDAKSPTYWWMKTRPG
jgi:hypothetical protein